MTEKTCCDSCRWRRPKALPTSRLLLELWCEVAVSASRTGVSRDLNFARSEVGPSSGCVQSRAPRRLVFEVFGFDLRSFAILQRLFKRCAQGDLARGRQALVYKFIYKICEENRSLTEAGAEALALGGVDLNGDQAQTPLVRQASVGTLLGALDWHWHTRCVLSTKHWQMEMLWTEAAISAGQTFGLGSPKACEVRSYLHSELLSGGHVKGPGPPGSKIQKARGPMHLFPLPVS